MIMVLWIPVEKGTLITCYIEMCIASGFSYFVRDYTLVDASMSMAHRANNQAVDVTNCRRNKRKEVKSFFFFSGMIWDVIFSYTLSISPETENCNEKFPLFGERKMAADCFAKLPSEIIPLFFSKINFTHYVDKYYMLLSQINQAYTIVYKCYNYRGQKV